MRILAKADIQKCITMRDAIQVMREAFIELGNNGAVQPLRTAVPIASNNAVTLTMPAYLSNKRQLGVKVASLFPQNHKYGIESINGVILVVDAETGVPTSLLEAGYLTALRTGAISGLATDLLARNDAETLCIIGSGTQAFTQLEAVTAVRDIKKIFVWSRNHANAIRFAEKFKNKYSIEAVEDINSATQDADVICTATTSETPLVHMENVKDGVHINAIGSHSIKVQELGVDIINNGLIVVDDKEAALREAGEIMHAINCKEFRAENIIEIGNILTKKTPIGSYNLSVFKSVGLAIQDISIANFVFQKAVEKKLGVTYKLSN